MAQADTAFALGVAGHAEEGLEDAFAQGLGHARAAVAHPDVDTAGHRLHADLDVGIGLGLDVAMAWVGGGDRSPGRAITLAGRACNTRGRRRLPSSASTW